LHQRSAAPSTILSGVGADLQRSGNGQGAGFGFVRTEGLVYQWSNPGSKPLVYLTST
jgi:hypothetical protein